MMRTFTSIATLLYATSLAAQDVSVTQGYIPVAPPGVMAHAAYLDLTNLSEHTRSLIGVTAYGYRTAHLHLSAEKDGVAAMAMVHQLDIAPGQTVSLRPGSFHIMLMHPDAKKIAGDAISLELHFADGNDVTAEALITPRNGGS